MEKNNLTLKELYEKLHSFEKEGITEIFIPDENKGGVCLSQNKKELDFLVQKLKECEDIFYSIPVSPAALSPELVQNLSLLYCSIEIPLKGVEKNGHLLLDKKLYSSKANLLNNGGLVFGFNMDWGLSPYDTFKLFRERLDFAVTLYPNHIVFPQFQSFPPKSTGIFSSKDMDFAKGIAFACRTFYTCGRAVPWFNSVLKLLKISATSFFADFDEWQQCNNCSFITDFIPEEQPHEKIEEMQLKFLEQKLEEKNKISSWNALQSIVQLNGAFSRISQENKETVLNLSYNPDDILSPSALNISSFSEDVPMENCTVKVYQGKFSPECKII